MPLTREIAGELIKYFPDGIIAIDVGSRKIIEINPVAVALLGYKADELIGKDVLVLHPATYREKVKNLISDLKEKRIPYFADIPFVRKNGEIFFADIASSTVRHNGRVVAFGFLRDRSKLMRKSCDWYFLYEQLAEMSDCAVSIVLNKKFVYVNRKFVDLLGAKAASNLIEKDIFSIIPQQDYERLDCIYESLVSGAIPIAIERQIICRQDGKTIDCLLRAVRTIYNGESAVHFVIRSGSAEGNDSNENLPDLTDNKKLLLSLTKRESEILCLIARGKTLKEIAGKLGIAYHTAMTHKHNIMKKLHLRTESDITRFAIKNGLVQID